MFLEKICSLSFNTSCIKEKKGHFLFKRNKIIEINDQNISCFEKHKWRECIHY
jgi:hypothetical protein